MPAPIGHTDQTQGTGSFSYGVLAAWAAAALLAGGLLLRFRDA